jgi:biotin carboxyl carrier protein
MKLDVTIDGRAGRIEIERDRFRYVPENGAPIDREFSLTALSPGSYSVLIEGRSYEVLAGLEIRVNGRPFSVEVFDPRSMRGRKTAGAGAGPQKIAAMMPGKVIRLLVAAGDTVEQGQGLIVVEAMKMQNEMKSPKAGRVAEIKTKAEATVAPGEVLMVIE